MDENPTSRATFWYQFHGDEIEIGQFKSAHKIHPRLLIRLMIIYRWVSSVICCLLLMYSSTTDYHNHAASIRERGERERQCEEWKRRGRGAWYVTKCQESDVRPVTIL